MADAEQVFVTAAVPEDVPAVLRGDRADRVQVRTGYAVREDEGDRESDGEGAAEGDGG